MSEAPIAEPGRGRATALLVVLVFVAPIIVAWWLAVLDPPQDAAHLLNHGWLIQPPIDIHSDPALVVFKELKLAPSDWALIHFTPGECTADCVRVLELLTTIRSLLGHDGTRVHVAAVQDAGAVRTRFVTPLIDPAARARFAALLIERLPDAAPRGVVLLDWRGQIMLYFPVDAPPADIKADLKRLLRASKIK